MPMAAVRSAIEAPSYPCAQKVSRAADSTVSRSKAGGRPRRRVAGFFMSVLFFTMITLEIQNGFLYSGTVIVIIEGLI